MSSEETSMDVSANDTNNESAAGIFNNIKCYKKYYLILKKCFFNKLYFENRCKCLKYKTEMLNLN